MNISEEELKERKGVNSLLKHCIENFGSMNKNDYEVALFNFMLQNDCAGKSDFQISLDLRIPESKVKRLRYEVNLKYPVNNNMLDVLGTMLIEQKYRLYNDRIQFVIKDKIFRLYLNDLLYSDSRFADSSFNSNVVSLTGDDLLFLLEQTGQENKEAIEKIRSEIKKGEKGTKEITTTLMSAFSKVLKGVASSSASGLVVKSIGELLQLLYQQINNT